MTRPFIEDFQRRRSQVRRYLSLVAKAERETETSGGREVDIARLHILRAGTFLILYNLVEASARGALEAIHDALTSERIPFDQLVSPLRREVVKGFRRKKGADDHVDLIDMPIDFVAMSLDVDHQFSGNVDARLIRQIADNYGFSHLTDSSKTRDGIDLLVVKNQRNDLAHGVKTYDEVGREFISRRILEIGIRSISYMQAILANVDIYIDTSGYLTTSPRNEDQLELF